MPDVIHIKNTAEEKLDLTLVEERIKPGSDVKQTKMYIEHWAKKGAKLEFARIPLWPMDALELAMNILRETKRVLDISMETVKQDDNS